MLCYRVVNTVIAGKLVKLVVSTTQAKSTTKEA